MNSAKKRYKGLTVEELRSCTSERQIQTAASSNSRANKEQPRETGIATRERDKE